jgi:4-hydroxybenzoate polyprenyltransferase
MGSSFLDNVKEVQKVKHFLKAMRPHQWMKNIFVLHPFPFLIAAGDYRSIITLIAATLSFCLAASSVYLINDIKDINQDRLHPKKSKRPIAAGLVSLKLAKIAALTLAVSSLILAFLVGWSTLGCLLIYLSVSQFYTYIGKHIPYVDILTVASLYSLRVLTGFSAISQLPNHWYTWVILAGILAFVVTLGKRKSEILHLGNSTQTRKTLSHYTDQRLSVMFYSSCVAIAIVYPMAALSISHTFVVSTLWVLVGLGRFWTLINNLKEDTHPQRVIFTDRLLVSTLAVFTLTFTAAVTLPFL